MAVLTTSGEGTTHYYYYADREHFAVAAILALGTPRVLCVSHTPRITLEFEHDGDRHYLVEGSARHAQGQPYASHPGRIGWL